MGRSEPGAEVKNMKYYDEGAIWYDILSSKGLPGELNFYVNEARKAKGKVLEVACGSGRIYLELLKAGVDAYGFDLSKGMLQILKDKAKERKLDTKVKRADMRNFKYPFKFDLIIIPYRAFNHMLTRKDQKKCLKNIRKHLKKGGRLILNFFDPRMDVVSKIKVKWKDGKVINPRTGKKVKYVCMAHYDIPNQLIVSQYVIENPKKGEPKEKLDLSLCYIFPREFMNMLELCGFKKWKLYGGFDYKPYKKHGSELVWIAYK